MYITIEVRKNDITRGKRRKCMECPVALATSRALTKRLGTPVKVSVGTNFLDIYADGDELASVVTPARAAEFMARFDLNEKRNGLKPFSFRLAVPL